MTKLEELTTLLVNEISDFNKSVEKLEHINERLQGTTIQMDLTELKSILKVHKQEMTYHQNTIQRFENHFESGVKRLRIYFSWLIVVFITSLIFSVIMIIIYK